MRLWPVMGVAAGWAMAGCVVSFAVDAASLAHADTVVTVQAVEVDSSGTAVGAIPSANKPSPAETMDTAGTTTLADDRRPAYLPPWEKNGAQPAASPATEAEPGEIMWSKPPAAASSDDTSGEIQWSNGGAASSGAGQLNTTGHDIEINIPLRDGGFYLGDVSARVSPSDEISIPRDRLVQLLTPILKAEPLETVKSLPVVEGNIAVASLTEKGFDFQFDPGTLELTINPTIEQRATGSLSGSNRREQILSENLATPALFAAYMNMRGGADYATQSFYEEEGTFGARVAFDGAAYWRDLVLESSATFGMNDGFSRGTTRFVYDMPERLLRIQAGDVSPLRADFQGGSDLLGISVEKSYQKLQPAANIRPTGSRSFRIERPSTVNVMINDHVTQRLQLRPGEYDLKDLPLGSGANDITLVIEDDVGQKRTLDFTVFSGASLLAPGISEWSVTGGFATHFGSEGGLGSFYSKTEYDLSTPVLTGFYERGLTPDLTGKVHLQADPDGVMGGGGAAFQTSFGFWVLDGALSQSFNYGPGLAVRLGYDLSNLKGEDGISRSFRVAADYTSEKFAPVGVLDPYNDTMFDMSVAYSQDLPWDLSGSLSGSYAMGRGDYADHYGVDLSLSRNLGPNLSAGLSAGYEQSLGGDEGGSLADGLKAAVRLSYRLDEESSIDAQHDARYGRSQLSYRHQEGTGIGSWNAQIELDRTAGDDDDPDQYGVGGSLGYTANRAEISLSQQNGLVGLDTNTIDQRTSVTAGTAIAFADGQFAFGRPISNGFAIVGMHENLQDSEVAIGASQDAQQSSSDFLGPALVSDVSPYSPSRVAYDVSNLPVGYDLGAGVFDLYPSYKNGYSLTVGSDYTVTAFGTLVDEEGEPIPLLTGVAYEKGHEDEHKVTIFTNKAGRFGAQGLRPGSWIIEMATEPKTRFAIDVPDGTVGLLKLETLKPVGDAS